MKYLVNYSLGISPEDRIEAVKSLNETAIECGGLGTYTLEDIPTTAECVIWANSQIDLEHKLINDYLITPEKIIDVKILVDDTQEVISDTKLLELANTEDACANYDWIDDNVVSFSRKVIAEYIKSQKGNP